MRFVAEREGRRPAGIGDHDASARFDPLIAGVRGIGDWSAARVVIGEHGRERIGGRRAAAVELGEGAVAVPEKAQHWHDAIDGVEKR